MSTLEVVSEADLLLIVLDASSDWTRYHLETTYDVLEQLDAKHIPHMVVLNKADKVTDAFERKRLELEFLDAVMVSAFNGEDMQRLKENISENILQIRKERTKQSIIERTSRAAMSNERM
jgi:GTP-binding protein HflX